MMEKSYERLFEYGDGVNFINLGDVISNKFIKRFTQRYNIRMADSNIPEQPHKK